MSTIAEAITALRELSAVVAEVIRRKPAKSLTSDNASKLGGITKESLLKVVEDKAALHIANKNNPHNQTAAKLLGVDKPYIDAGIANGVPIEVLSVSQYGDTTNANLGITTSGFVLTFTKPIQAYVMGTFSVFPTMTINLADTDPNPANKTFYIYVTLADGKLVYMVSQSKVAESLPLMCVGRVVTNATAITVMTIGRVSRIGTNRIATSPQGSAIPTAPGSPIQTAKLDPGWFPALDQITFTITVAQFPAPGQWRGFFAEAGGSTTPTKVDGITIRDLNVAQTDLLGPHFFQFGLYSAVPLARQMRYVSVGPHERLPYHSVISGGGITRCFFDAGEVDLYAYFAPLIGKQVTVVLWIDKAK